MSELGQQLREARLQKGMSLDDVQEMTKIRKRYLEAIEAGDYKVLPGSFTCGHSSKPMRKRWGLTRTNCLKAINRMCLNPNRKRRWNRLFKTCRQTFSRTEHEMVAYTADVDIPDFDRCCHLLSGHQFE